MKRWFVVYTHAQAETKALWHLCRQGFEAYLPRYARKRRHARKIETVAAPLFPRYLFVHLDSEAGRWRPIRSTVGVSHVVCHGDAPAPVAEGIVEEIRAREANDGLVRMDLSRAFRRGQKVQLIAGALAEQVGLFECRTDDERVIVLLSLLGRNVRVRVPAEALAAA